MNHGRNLLMAGAVFGATAIVLGAFGAHGLKIVLDADQLASFETGVKYQMYHALLLLIVGMRNTLSPATAKWVLYLTVAGTLFFSGSIYLLATREVTGLDIRPFGMITPVGGMLLIIAWVVLFVDFMRKKS